jgi:hypothetical protein
MLSADSIIFSGSVTVRRDAGSIFPVNTEQAGFVDFENRRLVFHLRSETDKLVRTDCLEHGHSRNPAPERRPRYLQTAGQSRFRLRGIALPGALPRRNKTEAAPQTTGLHNIRPMVDHSWGVSFFHTFCVDGTYCATILSRNVININRIYLLDKTTGVA